MIPITSMAIYNRNPLIISINPAPVNLGFNELTSQRLDTFCAVAVRQRGIYLVPIRNHAGNQIPAKQIQPVTIVRSNKNLHKLNASMRLSIRREEAARLNSQFPLDE